MLRQKIRLLRHLFFIIDLAITGLSFILAYQLRLILYYRDILDPIGPFYKHLWLLVGVMGIWPVLLKYYGGYEPLRRKTFGEHIVLLFKVNFLGMFIVALYSFLAREYFSRLIFISFILLNFISLVGIRIIATIILRKIRLNGHNCRHILIIGTGARAQKLEELFNSHPYWGIKVLGYLDDAPREDDAKRLGSRIIGKLDDLPKILDTMVVDEVIIALPRSWLHRLDDLVYTCEEAGVDITIRADLFNTSIAQTHFTKFLGIPILNYTTAPSQEMALVAKRIFDIVGSSLLLLLTAPLFFLISLAIKLTSPGPILFKQIRVGLHGRIFYLYKFRSMVVDAEKKLEEFRHLNEVSGPVFKIKNDPRVTPIGRLIRKFSLDELPQLINVLKGDMSLVGPRPPIPDEVAQYERWQRRRLSMRPGITCIWQVNGRNKISFEEWMKMDLQYIDNWSLNLDFKLLLKTVPAVLTGNGAS
jgi:exopolysaccharide biosynthesis polyprenyl glycosylphosphotransferase